MDIKNKAKQLKNWIWKISFFVTLIFCQASNADEVFRFTKITCIPELNYFDASVIDINSGSDEETDFVNDGSEELKTKYQLIGEKISDAQECKLKDSNIKIQINYRPSKETGICGGAPDATLKLWINQKLIVDLNHFNSCAGGRDNGIVHVGFKDFQRDREPALYFNTIGFDKTHPDGECVIWLNSQLKNIESNYCNRSKTNKTFPITDDFITNLLTNKNQ